MEIYRRIVHVKACNLILLGPLASNTDQVRQTNLTLFGV